MVVVKIQKSSESGSLVVSIPKAFGEVLGLEKGDEVNWSLMKDVLVLKKKEKEDGICR